MQGREGPCFAAEARQAFHIPGELWWEELQSDLAPQLRVGRPVDLPHASSTEKCGDFIVCEGRADQRRSFAETRMLEYDAA
jgi:hypothetical protein